MRDNFDLKGVHTMQATLTVKCNGCSKALGKVLMDTADTPGDLQSKVNKVILAHRSECPYYKQSC